jgi:hypothetical protein
MDVKRKNPKLSDPGKSNSCGESNGRGENRLTEMPRRLKAHQMGLSLFATSLSMVGLRCQRR